MKYALKERDQVGKAVVDIIKANRQIMLKGGFATPDEEQYEIVNRADNQVIGDLKSYYAPPVLEYKPRSLRDTPVKMDFETSFKTIMEQYNAKEISVRTPRV
jgi:hypothetical protein